MKTSVIAVVLLQAAIAQVSEAKEYDALRCTAVARCGPWEAIGHGDDQEDAYEDAQLNAELDQDKSGDKRKYVCRMMSNRCRSN